MSINALILSGGGARAAYQVGVLKAVGEIIPGINNPFPIICGTSAGAINAAAMAAHTGDFRQASHDLATTWEQLDVDHVFKTGWYPLIKNGCKAFASLLNDGIRKGEPLGLLDNSPLHELLSRVIPFENIQKRIDSNQLRALCITALGYNSGESVNFFQGRPELNSWRRYRRVGCRANISVDHLMASSAIPAVFPPVALDREYFGDGAMRQMAPISSALHLGADRVFIIGVSGNRNANRWDKPSKIRPKFSPSLGQILGQMFNSAFIDALEGDIEHLERVNALLALADAEDKDHTHETMHLRPVDTLIISPSKELDKIAGRKIRHMPKSIRFFLRKTGATARAGGSATASYLLFNHEYCKELMDLGYKDAMWSKKRIETFFKNE